MKQTAAVTAVNGSKAIIFVKREEACAGCKMNKACFSCSKTVEAEAVNTVGAVSGDIVEVETSSQKLLTYSTLVFVVPVVLGIALYCFGSFLFNSEPAACICGAIGFISPFIVLIAMSKRKVSKELDINIVRIVSHGENDSESRDNME